MQSAPHEPQGVDVASLLVGTSDHAFGAYLAKRADLEI